MRLAGSTLTVVLAMGILPGLVGAQSAVRGTVRADSSLRKIPAAEIVLEAPSPRVGRAGLDGAFLLGGLPAGRHQLVIRAIGYRPLRLAVELAGLDTLELDVLLRPAIQQLDPLTVAARPVPMTGVMEEFERRRKSGFGQYYSRADLRDRETMHLTDFLRGARGIRFVVLPIGCGSGYAVATMRPRPVDPPGSMNCGQHEITSACYLDLYVDGRPVWQWGQGPPPDIDQFAVRQLQAVEVYVGLAQTPAEFPQSVSGCGVLVMWGRTADRL